MANTIKLKRASGSDPSASDLSTGELAIRTSNCKLFSKNDSGSAIGIVAGSADTLTTARTIAGVSFDGSANISLNNNAITNGAGYLADIVSDTSPQLGGDLASNGNDILMGDNDEIKLGAGGDLKLEHQSSSGNSLITEVGGGDLIIQGSDIIIRDAGTAEKHIEMTQNGSVDLYHNGSKKVETSSTGIDINTGGSDLGSSIKIYGHDTIKRNYWGYGTTYKGIQIGRSDSNVNSSIFMGVDPSGNTSGAFGGYGQEIIFRNDLSFYHPNNANNNWHSFMRTGRFGDTGAANFPNGLGFGSDTATANVINDYEIGTYAPALGGNGNISGGNGMGLTYTTQAGYYIKIGDFVFCNGILVWTAKSGTLSNSSGVYCTLSIPFAQNNNNNQGAGQLSYNNGLDFNADCNSVHGVGSNSYIYFNRVAQGSGGHAGYVMTSNVSGSGQINFAYSYRIL